MNTITEQLSIPAKDYNITMVFHLLFQLLITSLCNGLRSSPLTSNIFCIDIIINSKNDPQNVTIMVFMTHIIIIMYIVL